VSRTAGLFRISIPCLLLVALATPPLHAQADDAHPPLIPKPAFVEWQEGSLSVTCGMPLVVRDRLMEQEAHAMAALFRRMVGCTLQVMVNPVRQPARCILLETEAAADSTNESYTLSITPERAIVRAHSASGAMHAMQTLVQLLDGQELPANQAPGEVHPLAPPQIPCVTIRDNARFAWRGLLLDCCRHFMSVEYIKRTVDMLAMLKMNRLHWHLTEDQGWRLAIDRYPDLVRVGAWRREADGSTYGGFYTKAQIRDVVAYAAAKHILVVPEIEMPGHALAALAAYPQFSCSGGPFTPASTWGVFKDIYCAGNDSTFVFLEHILDEVMDLFPSPWIHIGGDEAPKYRWEHCAKCRARMRAEKLPDAHALQSWFVRRIERYLAAHGRRLIGWDEILEGGLAQGATVQSWRGLDGAVTAAVSGHDAIVSPTSHAYFDYDPGTTSLATVCGYEPMPPGLDIAQQRHILGGECNMWTEYAPQEWVDAKLFPRILAMAEALWTPAAARDSAGLRARITAFYPVLDRLGVHYGFEDNPVRFAVLPARDGMHVAVQPGQDGLTLRCTVDGTLPGEQSPVCTDELVLRGPTVVKAIAVSANGLRSAVDSVIIAPHDALGMRVTVEPPAHRSYDHGAAALTDGVRGSLRFRDGRWTGFEGTDATITVDLGAVRPLHSVEAGFLHDIAPWIFAPPSVQFSASNDGRKWKKLGTDTPAIPTRTADARRVPLGWNGTAEARYIRLGISGVRRCPAWHDGAGGKAWVFIDEIEVR
jgi:hexosaminidase